MISKYLSSATRNAQAHTLSHTWTAGDSERWWWVRTLFFRLAPATGPFFVAQNNTARSLPFALSPWAVPVLVSKGGIELKGLVDGVSEDRREVQQLRSRVAQFPLKRQQ
jgi:hypothetical protein